VSGSINLRGGRLDDLRLNDFHETVDRASPTIVLLSPTGTPITPGDPHTGVDSQGPYFAEFGWLGDAAGQTPGPDTVWTAPAGAKLTTTAPAVLTFDNGAGLTFKRTIAIDDNYMFTVTDSVENRTGAAVNLTPYGRVTRIGEVHTSGYFILHEGMIGVFGDEGLQEYTYKNLTKTPEFAAKPATDGWLGVTSKYWAATLIPEKGRSFDGRFTRSQPAAAAGQAEAEPQYQADFRSAPVSVPAGGSAETTNRLFAGAKQVSLLRDYRDRLGIDRFDLLIDWGWFYFITKPMFFVIDWFYHLLGNFGLAILAVTVCVKLIFFPLANKSYKSMSGMKKVQPQMAELRERFKDDKMKQQQALMELYKKEKINPISGCWPMVLQIPVFFSLYKVLFVTIEMRHAPFFGWIQDLSAPDPSHIFNLFGLLPYNPALIPVIGSFLAIGIWPVIMGITMFVQMRLNPTPTDPAQQVIFTWMPVIFTFMLASFPAGLVIYWAWNNTLSVIQQYVIMRRQGVDVNLWGNISSTFKKKPKAEAKAKT
jgi:YidC/Oxa1 family membrane protein insertase